MSDIIKKITDTITETCKNVGEKTKQVGNTAKLNAKIISSERSVSENYTLIGKYYYDTYKENPDAEIADAVNSVTASLETIAEMKSQIHQIANAPLRRILDRIQRFAHNGFDQNAFCSAVHAPFPFS